MSILLMRHALRRFSKEERYSWRFISIKNALLGKSHFRESFTNRARKFSFATAGAGTMLVNSK